MNRDELDGKVKQVKGKVKQGIGDLTDDEELRDEGVADEAEGEVQEGVRHRAPESGRGREGLSVKKSNGRSFVQPHRVRGLIPLTPLCYICKVLVGPGTPYLGPDSKTRSLNARIADTSDHARVPYRRRLENTRAQLHQPL